MNAESIGAVIYASPSRWIKRIAFALFLVAFVAAFGAYAPRLLKTSTKAKHLTHTAARETLQVTITENGAVESSNNKEIKCLVKGGSTVLWVIETGTIVKPDDELVRLDQSNIEDNILRQQIVYENALANKITAESDVSVAEISVKEYLEGTFEEDRSVAEKSIFDAEQALRRSELSYESAMRLTAKGTLKELQLEGEKFLVDSAKKDLQLKETRLRSLEKYNKEKTSKQLESTLRSAQARLASFEASLQLEKIRLDREKEQLANCIIRADTEGMVIFPSMAEWKETPDIEEGAVVRERQTLLMIPDISQMQVKVGIHEPKIDRLSIGMKAKVQLQGLVVEGEVKEIAEITKPAGWWTGNLVKYDTKIKLPSGKGLKPGMSAIVDIVLAEYQDVLTLPVSAIIENQDGFFCWEQSEKDVKKRALRLGDSNDEFTVVLDGLVEGEKVVLNPLAFVDEAQDMAIQSSSKSSKKKISPKKAQQSKGEAASKPSKD